MLNRICGNTKPAPNDRTISQCLHLQSSFFCKFIVMKIPHFYSTPSLLLLMITMRSFDHIFREFCHINYFLNLGVRLVLVLSEFIAPTSDLKRLSKFWVMYSQSSSSISSLCSIFGNSSSIAPRLSSQICLPVQSTKLK